MKVIPSRRHHCRPNSHHIEFPERNNYRGNHTMAGYLDKPTRWAANISTTAKKKGAALVRRSVSV